MIRDILKAIVYCQRAADGKEFTERVICIPADRAKLLEEELNKRLNEGELLIVQIGRVYVQPAVYTTYEDEVDSFLEKIDEVKLPPAPVAQSE